jgi:hypothetical protein
MFKYHKTLSLFPKIYLNYYTKNNIKKSLYFPISNGEWITRVGSFGFQTRLIPEDNKKYNFINKVYLDKDVREVFIYSNDFETQFIHYLELKNINDTRPVVISNIDPNTDTFDVIKLY